MIEYWVLVDVSYLAYRAWYSVRGPVTGKEDVGVLFGVLDQVRYLCSLPEIASNCVCLCFDSSSSLRRNQFPAYKSSRKEGVMPEEREALRAFRRQVCRLRDEVLPSIGFLTYYQEGLEADDLAASAAKSCGRGVVVSADRDLWQCISSQVAWFNPVSFRWLTWDSFMDEFGIAPSLWSRVQAMAGCRGDAVPGIPGVGEVTALRFLRGELAPTSKKAKSILSPEGERIVRRNLPIVMLPHEATKPIVMKAPSYNAKAFERVCRRFGFQSFLEGERGRSWRRFFEGRMSVVPRNLRRRAKRSLPL